MIPYVDANCQIQGLVIDEPQILLVDQNIEGHQSESGIAYQRTVALEIPYERTWEDMLKMHPFLKEYPFDDCGKIPSHFKPDGHMRIFDAFPKIVPFEITELTLKAMEEVRVEYQMLPRSDNMIITLHGEPEHLGAIMQLWHNACNDEWKKQHHRNMFVQNIQPNELRIIFASMGNGFATPSHLLPRILALRLFHIACSSLQQPEGQIIMQLKIDGRHFSYLQIQEDFSFAPVIQCMKHSFFLRAHGLSPSIVAAGRRIADAMIGKDLITKNKNTQKTIVGHITMPIFGGAGSKQQNKQEVMTGLATMCLNAGMNLKEVPNAVNALTSQMGIPRLTHLIFMEDSDTKVEQFLRFCQDCDIQIPNNKMQMIKRQSKAQKTQHDRQNKAMRNIDTSQYSLQHGFFGDDKGNMVNINPVFSPCTPGVTMLSPNEAEKWLKQGNVLMPEPIAIFVVGDIELEISQRISKVIAPAINQEGNQVLLGGFLVQMGEQVVTVTSPESHIQTRDVQLCAFTMWKEDFSPEDWKQITSSPVRFAKQLLEPDGNQNCIRILFGRAFRNGDRPCTPEDSLSVQFHGEVKIQDLRKLLRRSGFNGLFITPKEEGGKPTAKWKPIWTDIPKATLEAKFVAHPATAGFIKGRKSTGIRVETAAYGDMWKIIKPDVPVPEQIPEGKMWKIQPLPFGVDKEIVNEWAVNIKWEAHAIRPLGSKAWVVSSSVSPPEGILTFNNHPLLVKPLKPRHMDTPIGLVAGPKSQGTKEQVVSSGSKNPTIFRTGDPFLDPWNGQQKKEESRAAGPTSQYFQHHDKRLDDLEKHVEQLREASNQTRTENSQRFATLEDRIQQQHSETKNAFTTLRADFESTLTQAMQRQDSQIASSMDEIKNLLLRREKRKAAEDNEDMDD